MSLCSQRDALDFFKSFGIPFEASFTGSSMSVTINGMRHQIADKRIKNRDLNFIKRVKSCMLGCGKPKPADKPISYFKFSNKKGEFQNILELDISAAYWNTALQKGYITKQLHREGLEREKSVRLIALGAAASVKTVFRYDADNEDLFFVEKISNNLGRSYFFDISRHVGGIMMDFYRMFPDAILFFWVDAIFIIDTYKAAAIEYFRQNGYDLKQKYVSKVQVCQNDYGNMEYKVFDNEKDPEKFKLFTKPASKSGQSKEVQEKFDQIFINQNR